jgi:hypothetical protein
VDELAVDDVGQPAFQAAHGFFMAFTGAALAQVVVAASTVAADLTDRHDVQAIVQLAVSCP